MQLVSYAFDIYADSGDIRFIKELCERGFACDVEQLGGFAFFSLCACKTLDLFKRGVNFFVEKKVNVLARTKRGHSLLTYMLTPQKIDENTPEKVAFLLKEYPEFIKSSNECHELMNKLEKRKATDQKSIKTIMQILSAYLCRDRVRFIYAV